MNLPSLIAVIFVGVFLLILLIVAVAEPLVFGRRGDGSISIKYPLPSDFENLSTRKSYFVNNQGNRFVTIEYTDKKIKKFKGVILFIHGIGIGHFYALRIINELCKQGYIVVAYDQYASGLSEGRKIISMKCATRDVKFAVKYIEENYSNYPFYVMGHSWGGYAASISLHFSNKIEKAVIISGFNTEEDAVRAYHIGPIMRFMMKITGFLRYGKNANLSALKCFKETKARVLYLQGNEDSIVLPKYSGFKFQKKLEGKPNITVKEYNCKGHSPFLTNDCEKLFKSTLNKFGLLGGKLVKMDEFVNFWDVSELDKNVIDTIFKFLK